MRQPIIVDFSEQLAHAQGDLERTLEEMLDALRWRACLRHGFPVRRPERAGAEGCWTIDGRHYAASATGAVDALLRDELSDDGARFAQGALRAR